ncbi:hypothetical protein E9840_05605 [Tissierella creatinini]|nr:hypothetical protein E9840_05605 [Tissierella creatinini]TJX65303.1 hypothetical protein E8P77_10620 [Soehngenia saccharolytica]
MLYEIVNDFPHEIINEEVGPFISLYQETHRHKTENRQDLIRFKNLVNDIRDSLKENYPKEDIEALLQPFNEIAEDRTFWNKSTDGLAVLANRNKCVVYRLARAVEEVSIVANSFYIKPLIRNFQSAERYHVLGLDRTNFALFEGNRYGFVEVEFPEEDDITKEEVLGDQHTEPHISAGSFGGSGATVFYGQGGRKEEVEKDTERYFRYVDKYIMEKYSNPTKLPLILATLDEHYGEFGNLSNNPYLYKNGIRKDYKNLTSAQLKEEAWKIIEPHYLGKTKALVERYNLERSKFLASDDIAEIARAAQENRVEILMAEGGKIIPGEMDKETGEILSGEIQDPRIGDLLNSISMLVIKHKGEVVVLPEERMPSQTGLAAIFRY